MEYDRCTSGICFTWLVRSRYYVFISHIWELDYVSTCFKQYIISMDSEIVLTICFINNFCFIAIKTSHLFNEVG